jgi:general secretion pathway protein D
MSFPERTSFPRAAAAVVVCAALLGTGCASRWAYRQAQAEARKGNWDVAVARLTKALEKDPDNITYKIALENARVQASRAHYAEAKKRLAADELDRAIDELEIASKFDPGNKSAADDLTLARRKRDRREDDKRRLAEFETTRDRAQAFRLPAPVLSPRSTAPINLNFPNQNLEKVLQALGKLAAVNIVFEESFRDKPVNVTLSGVTFEEALEQLMQAHRLFYRVMDRNTLIIIQDTQAKRRQWDELVLKTFYLQNAEPKDVDPIIKQVAGVGIKSAQNAASNSITVAGTPDQVALAERIIEANDKARGEVVVEAQIIEVNRTRLKQYGIGLANSAYQGSLTLSPTGAEGEVDGGFTSLRAHLLSSLNLADWIVRVPSTLFAKFLQSESSTRVLAAPRLRAAEGKKTSLKIGTEVPVPVTTFQTNFSQPGQGLTTPATSFQYRNVGVNLEITPKVTAAGEISLEVTAEFSSIGTGAEIAGQRLPTFLTRNVTGILRLRDGETTFIGGLLQQNERSSLSGPLGLPVAPILNAIFGDREKARDDNEVLISITPHLVRAPKITEEDLVPFSIGTEDQKRVPGARPPLFGPEPAPSPGPSPAAPPPPGPSPAPPTAPSGRPTGAELPPGEPRPTPAPTPPVRPVAASISPAQASVRVGDTTTLTVVVLNAQEMTGVELALGYDPALAQLGEVSPGTLLTLDGAEVAAERSLEPGRVRVKFTRPTPRAGSGVVAVLSFRGLGEGVSDLDLQATVLTPTGPAPAPTSSPARLVVSP